MMNKKWSLLVAAGCLTALLLGGCAKDPEPTAAPTDPTLPQPTQATVDTRPTDPPATEPPVTEPPVTEPPVEMEQAVTKLTCTKWRTFPQLQDLGGGLVLATRNQYSTDHQKVVCTVEILDLLNDTVVAETLLMHTAEPVAQSFSDGAVVLAVPSNNTLLICDSALQVTDTLEVSTLEGFFSRDRKNYYYAQDGMLCRMDVASGNSGAMALQSELRLERLVGVHPGRDLLVARVYLSAYSRNCGLAVIDAATGAVTMLTRRLDAVQIYGDRFCGMAYNNDIYGYDVYVGGFADGKVTRFDATELAQTEVVYSLVPGGEYLIRKNFTKGEKNVRVYDLATGGVCDLADHDFTIPVEGAVYLTGPQLIVGFYEDGVDFYPVVLDAKAMTFEPALTEQDAGFGGLVDGQILSDLEAELAGPVLPESLSAVRQKADEMERTYGIRILLGQQVEAPCAHGDFSVAVCQDAAAIDAALTKLETELAKYPEGFFKQFRNDALEGGVYFCLTGQITGGLETRGFARLSRDRYELALDITDPELAATVHHELWHAIEMRISVDAFALSGWDSRNPSGFAYYGRYDSGYTDLTRWTYADGNGTDSYFVETYSRINGREDRATVFEAAMTGDAEVFLASAIQSKLSLMDSLMRQTFNASRWTGVYWEQFL